MSSVNTNVAAMTALRILQNINKDLDSTQNRISKRSRIAEAKDNAAYWAIAETMKSENRTLSTVKDALGLGSAMVDTAYQGLDQVKEVLDEIKSKLTAATQVGADKNKLQSEITELQNQLQSIATSATFSGENWLSVNSSVAGYSPAKSVVASFNRASSGSVSIGTIGINTATISLYDASTAAGADGILDAAITPTVTPAGGSSLGTTAGGLIAASAGAGNASGLGGTPATAFGAATTFDETTDKIVFDLDLNGTTYTGIEIRRGTVQTALNNFASSVAISSMSDMALVINQALANRGITGLSASVDGSGKLKYVNTATGPAATNKILVNQITWYGVVITYQDFETNSANNTYTALPVEMNAFTGPIQFTAAADKIKFSIKVNAGTVKPVEITKATVTRALGTTDGKINSAAEFQQVVIAALGDPNNNGDPLAAIGGVTVGSSAGKVTFKSNTTTNATAIAISAVSTEGFAGTAGASAAISVKDIDISDATLTARGATTGADVQATITAYIDVVSRAIERVTTAAAKLGAVAKRIDLQQSFVNTLMDTIDRGIGSLIDVDISEESTKLQALQVKQQLGVQMLSIANQSSQNILRLFQ